MKIGLTGGIASGKSTVASILKSLGVKLIHGDKIAHELMKPGERLWEKVIDCFGEEILEPNGRHIDRDKLGDIIFNNPDKKEDLDECTHYAIACEIKSRLDKLAESHKLVAADVPLLIEMGMVDYFDEVWLVYIEDEVQIKRLKERDGIDREAALKKIESQLPFADKKESADRVIDNNGSKEELEEQVKKIVEEVS